MVETKICKLCGAEKPLTEFYAHRYTRDRLQNKCKSCSLATVRKSRELEACPLPAPAQENPKVCRACGMEKPVGAFSVNSGYSDGRQTLCKDCFNVRQRQRGRVRLSEADMRIMQALRNQSLKATVIQGRYGVGGVALGKLVERGFIAADGEGYYGLTDLGGAVCPYRNRTLEARRQQALRA